NSILTLFQVKNLFRIYLTIIFLIITNLFAFGQDYSSIVNKPRKDWHDLIHKKFYTDLQFRKDSVAFFKEIDKLKNQAEFANDQQLFLESKFIKYNFLSSRNYPNYLEEVTELQSVIDNEGIKQLQTRIRQAIGLHHFYETNRYETALRFLTQTYQFLKVLSNEDLPDNQQ